MSHHHYLPQHRFVSTTGIFMVPSKKKTRYCLTRVPEMTEKKSNGLDLFSIGFVITTEYVFFCSIRRFLHGILLTGICQVIFHQFQVTEVCSYNRGILDDFNRHLLKECNSVLNVTSLCVHVKTPN